MQEEIESLLFLPATTFHFLFSRRTGGRTFFWAVGRRRWRKKKREGKEGGGAVTVGGGRRGGRFPSSSSSVSLPTIEGREGRKGGNGMAPLRTQQLPHEPLTVLKPPNQGCACAHLPWPPDRQNSANTEKKEKRRLG